MSAINLIPRTTVRLSLSAARLPLTASEVVFGHRGEEEWPPALAFEALEAGVKQVAGGLLRDDVLVDEGRLVRAKVDRLRQASTLETEAEQRRQDTTDEFETRRHQNAEKATRAEREKDQRTAQITEQKAEAKRKADQEARRVAARARDDQEKADAAAARRARRSRLAALDAEEKALAKDKAAAKRARDAKAADTKLQATNAARKRRG